jgi:hypothetical protein
MQEFQIHRPSGPILKCVQILPIITPYNAALCHRSRSLVLAKITLRKSRWFFAESCLKVLEPSAIDWVAACCRIPVFNTMRLAEAPDARPGLHPFAADTKAWYQARARGC